MTDNFAIFNGGFEGEYFGGTYMFARLTEDLTISEGGQIVNSGVVWVEAASNILIDHFDPVSGQYSGIYSSNEGSEYEGEAGVGLYTDETLTISNLARINLSDGHLLDVEAATVMLDDAFVTLENTGGDDGGFIFFDVSGNMTLIDGSTIFATTEDGQAEDRGSTGAITLDVGGDLSLSAGSQIYQATFDTGGTAGSIGITVEGTTTLTGFNPLVPDTKTGILTTSTTCDGSVGEINLTTGVLVMSNEAVISSSSIGETAEVTVGQIDIDVTGEATLSDPGTTISTSVGDDGTSQGIAFNAASLTADYADISATATGGGTLEVLDFEITGTAAFTNDTDITISIVDGASAGISLEAGTLTITDSDIEVASTGDGDVGNIDIVVDGDFNFQDDADIRVTLESSGDAAGIEITAGSFTADGLEEETYIGISSSLEDGGGDAGLIAINVTGAASFSNNSDVAVNVANSNSDGISLTAGTLTIDDSDISISSSGETVETTIGAITVNVTGAATMSNEADISSSVSEGDSQGIDLTAATFTMNSGDEGSSTISVSSSGAGTAGLIDIGVTGAATMNNGSFISSTISGAGSSMGITIESASLDMNDGVMIYTSTSGSNIEEAKETAGAGGDITIITSGDTTLATPGLVDPTAVLPQGHAGAPIIYTSTSDEGDGGDITIVTTGDLILDSSTAPVGPDAVIPNIPASTIMIYTSASDIGDGGDISIVSANVEMTNSLIYTHTSYDGTSAGFSGDITITADDYVTVMTTGEVAIGGVNPLDQAPVSRIYTSTTGLGDAGDILITATDIEFLDGSQVLSQTSSTGATGEVTLDGSETIRFDLDTGFDWSFDGVATGTGEFIKEGTGTLNLTGTNTYGSTTTVSAGELHLENGAAIPDASATTLATGTTLELVDSSETIGSLAGDGDVVLNTYTLTAGGNDDTTTYSGVIAGTGGFTKEGTGTMTLTDNNTYTGATNLNEGMIKLNSGGETLSDLTAVTAASGTTLELVDADEIIGSLAGAGNVTLNEHTLTAGGNDGTTTYSGVIAGTGGLIKEGDGNMTISGTNTFTGDCDVEAGTLTLDTATAIEDSVAVTVFTDATMDLNDLDETIGSLAGAGDVTLGTGFLTTGGNDDTTTFSGDMSGTGGLVKEGTGTLTFSGTNTYTGTTSINVGTLQLAGGLALSDTTAVTAAEGTILELTDADEGIGSLAGAGNVTLGDNILTAGANDTSTTYSGVIAGTGGLTKTGDGTMTLTGENIYTGATTIDAGGTLKLDADGMAIHDTSAVTVDGTLDLNNLSETIGSLAGTGSVTMGTATLTTGGNDGITTFSGAISGTADVGLIKLGTGTMTLSGTNTFTGDIQLNVGTLQLAGGTAIEDSVAVSTLSGAVLDVNGSTETIGSLSGAGNVTLGEGILTAGGNNDTTTYSGVISGPGEFVKAGTGTMYLTDSNTLTGSTHVTGGTLALGNGTLTGNLADSDTWVEAAAILAGTGQVNDLIVHNNGTVSPGLSIGTITVNGEYYQDDGSLYECEIGVNATNDFVYDLIDVAGDVTLEEGAMLTIKPIDANGDPDPDLIVDSSLKYPLIDFGGTRTGSYGLIGITDELELYTATVLYEDASDRIVYMLLRDETAFEDIAAIDLPLSGNQDSVSERLDEITEDFPDMGIEQDELKADLGWAIDEISLLPDAQKKAAVDSLSGEHHGNVAGIVMAQDNFYHQVVTGHLRSDSILNQGVGGGNGDGSDMPNTSPVSGWAEVQRTQGESDADQYASGYEFDTTTLALGYEKKNRAGVIFGLGGGISKTNVDGVGRRDRSDIETTHLSLYGRWEQNGQHTIAIASYATSDNESFRPIVIGAETRLAKGDFDSETTSFYLERGFKKNHGKNWVRQPILSARYSTFERDRFTETGAGGLGLQMEPVEYTTMEGSFGFDLTRSMSNDRLQKLYIRYTHDFTDDDLVYKAYFPARPEDFFQASGIDRSESQIEVGIGQTKYNNQGNSSFTVMINGIHSDNSQSVGVKANYTWRW